MIAYLSGKIVLSRPGAVILETGGVGYRVNILHTKSYSEGSNATFYLFEQLREDCDELFGFEEYSELELFEKLVSVNGVGPRVGIAIMSLSSGDKIINAIINDDADFFQSMPGIGRKTAAKIILDLKDKFDGKKLNKSEVLGNDLGDVIEALTMLGYKRNEIDSLAREIPLEIKVSEQKVKWCLQNLNKRK